MPVTVAVLSDDVLKQEILSHHFAKEVEFVWADSLRSLGIIEADAYFDLLFQPDHFRIAQLTRLSSKPVFVNAVAFTCRNIGGTFIRINAWPTMLKREVAEVAAADESAFRLAENFFHETGWKFQRVPDVTGMLTPRVVAMICNEACYALGEGISTRAEIDVAMKLGTNYPYGPFEWMEKIGSGRIKELLTELQRSESRYTIASALLNQQDS